MSCAISERSSQIKISENGRTVVAIVTGNDPTPAEQTAAREFAVYLGKVTGADFQPVKEAGFKGTAPAIYLGRTAFAQKAGIDFTKLGEEEWVIRTTGGDLILAGGRPRGTLYAVYEFLQNHLGCYWLTKDAEVVPRNPSLSIPAIDVQGKPAFRLRGITQGYYVSKDLNFENMNKYADFTMRNRGNYSLWGHMSPDRGGRVVTSPQNPHSYYCYVQPSKYYKSHPEYFLLDSQGRRAPALASLIARNTAPKELDSYGGDGLCLFNKDVYGIVMKSLREFIARDRAKTNYVDIINRPFIYDFTQMDNQSEQCRCPECKALFEAEGSDAGPILKFVNAMADEIRLEYPEIMIRTFAYVSSEKPPKTIKPRDNVMIYLADLYMTSDCYRPLTHPVNKERLALLKGWSAIARNIMIWDYWNFNLSVSEPQRCPPDMIPPAVIHSDLNTFLDNNVMGLYIEAEGGVNVQNFHDLDYFLGFQLLVNPRRPYEPLVDIFMEGYYGPAAKPMKAFLKHLDGALTNEPGSMAYAFQPAGRQYPTTDFYAVALKLLNEADALCPEGSPEKLRVWREKVPVYNGLLSYWGYWDKARSTAKGKIPFDKAALIAEYDKMRAALITSPANVHSDERRQASIKCLLNEIAVLKMELPIPEQFKHIARERIRDVVYPDFGRWPVRLVDDEESPAKKAVVYYVNDPEKCTLPLTTGVYDDLTGFASSIKIDKAPADEKYHWYQIGRCSLGKQTGIYGSSMFVHHPWSLRITLDGFYTVADGIKPGSKGDPNLYDIYLSLKITGPAYVPGSTKKNAILVDRVILIRPDMD